MIRMDESQLATYAKKASGLESKTRLVIGTWETVVRIALGKDAMEILCSGGLMCHLGIQRIRKSTKKVYLLLGNVPHK